MYVCMIFPVSIRLLHSVYQKLMVADAKVVCCKENKLSENLLILLLHAWIQVQVDFFSQQQ
jgi:hypothetical protein